MRLSDAEVIEFINIHHLTVEVVDFVDHQHNRLAASSEHISYFCIGIYKALTDVSDEDDDICGINGDLRLVSHLGENDIFGFRLNTAGVYQRKFVVQPLHVGINTVTGYTGVSFTIEILSPANTLNRVDLPTFGRPTIATIGLLIHCSPSVYRLLVFLHNGFHQVAARLIDNLYRCFQALFHLFHRHIVEKDVFSRTEHVARKQQAVAKISSL